MLTASAIKEHARAVGFDLCGIARAERHPRLSRLAEWIDRGFAGDMRYLSDSLDERLDPRRVLPTARSIIALACVYNTSAPRSTEAVAPGRAAIARYAWGDDYHDVLRNRMRRLLQWMADEAGPGFEAFSCVDSGPVQERVVAEQAGLGWIGKNSCLINPKLGSWLFLAEIVTTLPLRPDAPGFDQCGLCTLCLDACPTGALVDAHVLDARKCLSYLTIELRGSIPPEQRQDLGSHVFGCDICQDVCPWNRLAAVSDRAEWRPRTGLDGASLSDLASRTDDDWRAALRGSAMRRA